MEGHADATTSPSLLNWNLAICSQDIFFIICFLFKSKRTASQLPLAKNVFRNI